MPAINADLIQGDRWRGDGLRCVVGLVGRKVVSKSVRRRLTNDDFAGRSDVEQHVSLGRDAVAKQRFEIASDTVACDLIVGVFNLEDRAFLLVGIERRKPLAN